MYGVKALMCDRCHVAHLHPATTMETVNAIS